MGMSYEPVTIENRPAGNFDGLAAASAAPWSARVLMRSAFILPCLVGGQLGVDVIVAGERVRLQVLAAILDPLDRSTGGQRGHDGAHVARVDRHFAAEPAADIGRDDADLVLGDLGDQREHGPNRVRRLGRHPHGQLAADLVEAGDAAARLDRGDVDARDVDVLGDDDVGIVDRGLGGGSIADFPVPDVVGLLLLVGSNQRRVRLRGP